MRIALIAIASLLTACGQGEPTNTVEPSIEANVSGKVESTPGPPSNSAAMPANAQDDSTPEVGACRKQGDKEIAADPIKAVGTEPFWAAVTEGRCVTYSTPENQQGTRIWTTFTGTREAGQWKGFLGKNRFVLITRPEPGCTDGMSDRRFPIAVTLTIGSEERRGCASPA